MPKGGWMITSSGKQFYPLDPETEKIDIKDIAHSLSLQCRWAGHVKCFYSVAQHSYYVAEWIEEYCKSTNNPNYKKCALVGLLHDASESYLVDLPRPIKNYSELGTLYKQIEGPLQTIIYDKYILSVDSPYCYISIGMGRLLHDADNAILRAEARDLMPPPPGEWNIDNQTPAWSKEIIPIGPDFAEKLFLEKYKELTN